MDENDWMIGPLQPPMALNNKKTKRQKGQKYWPKSRAKSRGNKYWNKYWPNFLAEKDSYLYLCGASVR
jgi:hypothetical protein